MLQSKKTSSVIIKNAFSINFPFYVFALGILLAFSAFQCEGVAECEDPLDGTEIYSATLTVQEVICGTGLWENHWFNDGSKVYLQPYSITEDAQAKIAKLNIDIKDGLRLKIQYQHAKEDGRYNDVIICLAYVGEKTPIHIVDIEVVND